MKTRLVAILALMLLTGNSFAQNKVRFELLSIKKDTVAGDHNLFPSLAKPKTIHVAVNPISKIEALSTVNGKVLGIQFEVLKTGLENADHLVFGMSLYQKPPGTDKWQALGITTYMQVLDENQHPGKKGNFKFGWLFHFQDDPQDYILDLEAYINQG